MTHRVTLAVLALAIVVSSPSGPLPRHWVAFLDSLRALGYVEDQTIRVEWSFAGGRAERVPQLARALAERKVDVIVVTGTREVQAARQATTTIPIVTILAPDPVASGLVASLARPGGNITGLTFSASGVGEKYVEMLREAVPSASRMAVLASRPQAAALNDEMRNAARALNVSVLPIRPVNGPEEFDTFFARARSDGAGAVIVPSDGVTNLHRKQVVDAAAKHQLPAIYAAREFVELGGLMAPAFVDKILKGARPAELPMEQPTKFELVLNLKTARALGLSIRPTLLARADEIIQ